MLSFTGLIMICTVYIQDLSVLQELDLSSKMLYFTGLKMICTVYIQDLSVLQELDLSSNMLSFTGLDSTIKGGNYNTICFHAVTDSRTVSK
jgi:hypothetical protein